MGVTAPTNAFAAMHRLTNRLVTTAFHTRPGVRDARHIAAGRGNRSLFNPIAGLDFQQPDVQEPDARRASPTGEST